MAFKRALVVDDSKTARQSLAKLLAQYDLEVAFAESGEDALHFLQHELVDVIFMDHTMPGMDGLETVSAIKSIPRTATIPVMMYTTREGEVYVGQARALGAVGVLPKEVQPGVLFDMLNKLGLVQDRRGGAAPPADAPRRRLSDLVDQADEALEQRALGVSVQAVVTRILEEQHQKLRADILGSQRRFAHQVASEVLRACDDAEPADAPLPAEPRPARWPAIAAAVTTAMLLATCSYAWQLKVSRDAAYVEIARMTTASRNEVEALYARNDSLSDSLSDQSRSTRDRDLASLQAVAWALNESPLVDFDALPFGDAAAARLGELVTRLAHQGFRGRIRLTAQLAPFCLRHDASGELVRAAAEFPVDACEHLGHPLEDVGNPSALQSVAFANVLRETAEHPDIDVRLAVRHPQHVLDEGLLPPDLTLAGAWNDRAAALNRLAIGLEPGAEPDSPQLARR